MHSVSKEQLLGEFNFQDKAEFKGRLEEIVNDIFDSLRFTTVRNNLVEGTSTLDEWKHRSIDEIETDWAWLEIDRSRLQNALERYLDLNSIRSKNMDWLFIDVLTYAEYIATIDVVRRQLLDSEKFIKQKGGATGKSHNFDVGKMLKRWWHWPLNIIILSLSFVFFPIGPLVFSAYIAWRIFRKNKRIEKINGIFESMLQTYQSINTASLGWQSFQNSLNLSKERGAIWDSSVFNLVERRINQNRLLN
jgi:hypothetical protein